MDTDRVIKGGRLRAINPADVGVHAISGATAAEPDPDSMPPDDVDNQHEHEPDPQS